MKIELMCFVPAVSACLSGDENNARFALSGFLPLFEVVGIFVTGGRYVADVDRERPKRCLTGSLCRRCVTPTCMRRDAFEIIFRDCSGLREGSASGLVEALEKIENIEEGIEFETLK